VSDDVFSILFLTFVFFAFIVDSAHDKLMAKRAEKRNAPKA
jgi:hypothetical protein